MSTSSNGRNRVRAVAAARAGARCCRHLGVAPRGRPAARSEQAHGRRHPEGPPAVRRSAEGAHLCSSHQSTTACRPERRSRQSAAEPMAHARSVGRKPPLRPSRRALRRTHGRRRSSGRSAASRRPRGLREHLAQPMPPRRFATRRSRRAPRPPQAEPPPHPAGDRSRPRVGRAGGDSSCVPLRMFRAECDADFCTECLVDGPRPPISGGARHRGSCPWPSGRTWMRTSWEPRPGSWTACAGRDRSRSAGDSPARALRSGSAGHR
jgi:hypothetical protein